MCQIKSAIVLKDRIFMPYDYDNHSQMLETLEIKDDNKDPQFVRVEMCPIDGNIFNHDLSNWKLKVDQDFRPEWFSEKFTEEEMKKELGKWWQERFILNDKTWKKLKDGRFYIKNSSVEAWENSSVVARGDSSVVAWEDSSVVARENSSVVAWEDSSVVARENSSVEAWENSSVVARGDSSVVARENSSVEAWGNSQILLPNDYPVKIKGVYDNASVKDVTKGSIIVANKNFKLVQFEQPKEQDL